MSKQVTTTKTKHQVRGPRGRVVIFGTWCKDCGLCVEFCPAGVLALDEEGHPYVAAPEKCTACRWCEIHCPDCALIVQPIEEAAERGGKP